MEVERVGEVLWYVRSEQPGPWRIAACAAHGTDLEKHRFLRAGPTVDVRGTLRAATSCAVCSQPRMLETVARCTCELDAARCPEHQNVGCGG